MAKKTLSDIHKRSIIRRLAHFETPSEVAAAIKEDYEMDITPQSVEFYDPSKNPKLIREWVELFDRERERYLTDFDAEPLNSLNFRQAARLRVLKNRAGKAPKIELQVANDAADDYFKHAEMMRKQGTLPLPNQPPAGTPAPGGRKPNVTDLNRDQRIDRIAQLLERRRTAGTGKPA